MHVALFETHAMSVLDIDRGNDLHGSGGCVEERSWRLARGLRRRSLRLSVPGDEIGEQAQTRALALFGVELHGEDISPRYRASKRRRVGRRCRRQVRIGGNRMVAVSEVE